MNVQVSTYQFEKIIDEPAKTAIIYPLTNIDAIIIEIRKKGQSTLHNMEVFIIEIREKGQSTFLLEGKELKHFYSLNEAKLAAINAGVKKAYLAMDNIYDESGSDTFITNLNKYDYDYMLIDLEKMTY